MKRHSRRDFLAGSAGAASLAFTPAFARAAGPFVPDTIVINANVCTLDDRRPKAQAFAIKGDRFVAAGATADIRRMAGSGTRTVDAHGATIVPGFIDCHNHAPGDILLYEVLINDPYGVEFTTIDGIVAKMKARAQQTAPGYWVEGYFFDDTKVKDGRPLTIHDLDRVSTDLPVVVNHRGGHTFFYNSKAFEIAGVTKNTPNPPGGTFDKDPSGELTGRVTDTARVPFQKPGVGLRPTYSPEQTVQRQRDAVAFISKKFVSYGLTSVAHSGGSLMALQQVHAANMLLHRVSYEAQGAVLEDMINGGIETGLGDEWIKMGATFEHTADGSFSERTMALSTPYAGTNPPYYGNITETQDQLNTWVDRVHRAGIQANFHANGDVAIEHVLTALERAQQNFPRKDARPKITHCTDINPDLVRRIKAIAAVPALFTTYSYYNAEKFKLYGQDMLSHFMAYRTLLDAGIPVCAGSDFTAGALSPLMGLQGMVTRRGWNGEVWGANQKISVDEALRVYTKNGAYATFEENLKGTITPGKLADYVMLAADPHTVDPNTIKDIKILRTVTGARTVYSA